MKKLFRSNQYNVSEAHLERFFQNIEGVSEIHLWNIELSPSGYGHYKIISTFFIDGDELVIKRITPNMQLIDAWKSGMKDMYEDGEDGFNNWGEVVKGMLYQIDLENELYNL